MLPANYVLHIAHASAKWRADADKSMVNVDKLGCDFLSDVQRKYQHTAAEQVLSMPDQHSCWGAMSKCHAVTRLKVGAADGGAASTYMRKDVTYEQFMHKVAVSHGQVCTVCPQLLFALNCCLPSTNQPPRAVHTHRVRAGGRALGAP